MPVDFSESSHDVILMPSRRVSWMAPTELVLLFPILLVLWPTVKLLAHLLHTVDNAEGAVYMSVFDVLNKKHR